MRAVDFGKEVIFAARWDVQACAHAISDALNAGQPLCIDLRDMDLHSDGGAMDDADKLFTALADPSRRTILDLLSANNGQTLSDLCEHLDMKRRSTTKHIDILIDANLVTSLSNGREKLHFINPIPIHEIYERWIPKFERRWLRFLHDLKVQLKKEDET